MRRVFMIAGVIAGLCAGCGQGQPVVDGKVTLDGSAIDGGSISFSPIGGTKGPVVGATIGSGAYRISGSTPPVVGGYRVEIRAPRKTGKKVPGPMAPGPGEKPEMVEETVESVPAKYNEASTLEKEIKAGKNVLDFELTSR